VDRLVLALLGETPLVSDLRSLTDEVGGRATGSPASVRAVEWALERFRASNVPATREPFTMPALWLEKGSRARVSGGAGFPVRVTAMPFSAPADERTAPLVDAGTGSDAELKALGPRARGAFLLVETKELLDLTGLFAEYNEGARIERAAFGAGAAGVVYMGSRPGNLDYRHNASMGTANAHPLLVMERGDAGRALRLLRDGKRLDLTATIELQTGGPYESSNVIGEIRGGETPEEIVLVGAHLDSWDLGTGALDNGCNVAMLIDIARQIRALGLVPKRTIRFALWNGEEQGFFGSWAHARGHRAELDRYVVAASFDIGSGRIDGFFTNGRGELIAQVDRALQPVKGLGPFTQVNEPIVGTDNFDFLLEGVPNLVASQETANYGPNYHARSDTFDKVDLRQLRLNAAVAAAVTWAFANHAPRLPRQSRAEVEQLVDHTSLRAQMESFGLLEPFLSGQRGREKPARAPGTR
jgi:hypothetical protein